MDDRKQQMNVTNSVRHDTVRHEPPETGRRWLLRACRPAYRRASLPLMRVWTSSGLGEEERDESQQLVRLISMGVMEAALTGLELFYTGACI